MSERDNSTEAKIKHTTPDARLLRVALDRIDDLEAENVRVKQRNQRMRDYAHGAYWCWQGDEEDHPESLACPVLISADDLRSILADRRLLEAGEKLDEAVREYFIGEGWEPEDEGIRAALAAYQEAAKA